MKILVIMLVSFLVVGCASRPFVENEPAGAYIMNLDCSMIWCDNAGCHDLTVWERQDVEMCRAADW